MEAGTWGQGLDLTSCPFSLTHPALQGPAQGAPTPPHLSPRPLPEGPPRCCLACVPSALRACPCFTHYCLSRKLYAPRGGHLIQVLVGVGAQCTFTNTRSVDGNRIQSVPPVVPQRYVRLFPDPSERWQPPLCLWKRHRGWQMKNCLANRRATHK